MSVAIFAIDFSGYPDRKISNNYATVNAFGCPDSSSLASTQQGIETWLSNDLMPFSKACIFTTLLYVRTNALYTFR
jgi:hypothetical protein